MTRRSAPLLLMCVMGCVRVTTPNVDVRVNQLDWSEPPADGTPAHVLAFNRVISQRADVLEELHNREWEDVVEETDEWARDIRRLRAHAYASDDPKAFSTACDRLVQATHSVRQAALLRDAAGCTRAIGACDPLLDRINRGLRRPESVRPAAAYPPPSDRRGTHTRP